MTDAAMSPVKPRVLGSPEQTVVELIDANKGAKKAAHVVERSKTVIYAWTDADAGRPVPYWAIRELTAASRCTAAAEDLAALAGAMIVPALPEVQGELGRIIAATVKETCEAATKAVDVGADGVITPTESHDAEREAIEAIHALSGWVEYLRMRRRVHNQE